MSITEGRITDATSLQFDWDTLGDSLAQIRARLWDTRSWAMECVTGEKNTRVLAKVLADLGWRHADSPLLVHYNRPAKVLADRPPSAFWLENLSESSDEVLRRLRNCIPVDRTTSTIPIDEW